MQLKKIEIRKTQNRLNKKNRLQLVVGFLIFIIGVGIYTGNILYNNYLNGQDDKKVEEFLNNENNSDIPETEVSENGEIQTEENIPTSTYNYIGVLEIPKINLKKGIVDKTSASNNVNKNIYTLKETTLPDEQINSHIILAGHSGNSYISFFKNLKKLSLKDFPLRL